MTAAEIAAEITEEVHEALQGRPGSARIKSIACGDHTHDQVTVFWHELEDIIYWRIRRRLELDQDDAVWSQEQA